VEALVGIMTMMKGHANLPQVVRTLDATRGFAHSLHGGQQQGDQHSDDRDDDEQLDQGEASTRMAERRAASPSLPVVGAKAHDVDSSRLPLAYQLM
jgi:hypothetical protein